MAVFNIHPRFAATLNCEIAGEMRADLFTTGYVVDPNSIDMNEEERETAVNEHGSMVEISFRIYVFADTQPSAMANARTLKQALSNQYGGHIEYRPIGLGDSILTTWYHYSSAAPPELVEGGVGLTSAMMEKHGFRNAEQKYMVILDFKVPIKPWATSNPETLQAIVSQTTLDASDDASRNNYINVPSSSIKGDILFPVLTFDDAGDGYENVFVQLRPYTSGSASTIEVLEAESMAQVDFSNQSLAAASNGEFERTTASTGELRANIPSDWDSQLVGKFVPLIIAKVNDVSTVWEVYLRVYSYDLDILIQTDPIELDYDNWRLYYTMEEIQIPPYPIPSLITDDTTPDIGGYAKGLYLIWMFSRTSGSATLDVDFIHLARVDTFAAMFRGWGNAISSLRQLKINAWDQLNYVQIISGGALAESWTKYGSPLSSLVMPNVGLDYRLRMIPTDAFENYLFTGDDQFKVTVQGIFGTIYPFEES